MKALTDLHSLIPIIIKEFKNEDFEIGNYDEGEYERNVFEFENQNWHIVVDFECTGIYEHDYSYGCSAYLDRGWGSVENISVTYYDEDDNETELSKNELSELWSELTKVLKNLN